MKTQNGALNINQATVSEARITPTETARSTFPHATICVEVSLSKHTYDFI
jgi:hypothetical protein